MSDTRAVAEPATQAGNERKDAEVSADVARPGDAGFAGDSREVGADCAGVKGGASC